MGNGDKRHQHTRNLQQLLHNRKYHQTKHVFQSYQLLFILNRESKDIQGLESVTESPVATLVLFGIFTELHILQPIRQSEETNCMYYLSKSFEITHNTCTGKSIVTSVII